METIRRARIQQLHPTNCDTLRFADLTIEKQFDELFRQVMGLPSRTADTPDTPAIVSVVGGDIEKPAEQAAPARIELDAYLARVRQAEVSESGSSNIDLHILCAGIERQLFSYGGTATEIGTKLDCLQVTNPQIKGSDGALKLKQFKIHQFSPGEVTLRLWGKVVPSTKLLGSKKDYICKIGEYGGTELYLDGSRFCNPMDSSACLGWMVAVADEIKDGGKATKIAKTATEGREAGTQASHTYLVTAQSIKIADTTIMVDVPTLVPIKGSADTGLLVREPLEHSDKTLTYLKQKAKRTTTLFALC